MESGAGIYRTRDSLQASLDKLAELRDRFKKIAIHDHHREFNTQLTSALELSYMLDVSEAVMIAAMHREESRGAHQRRDFPKRDDERYLAHSMVSHNPDGSAKVDFLPVTITRWPPGERVYGR